MIKICIADDHTILSEALKIALEMESMFKVVGVFNNCKNTLSGIKGLEVDVLLLDLSMPDEGIDTTNQITGLDVLDYIAREKINIKVIILSNYSEFSIVSSALKKGAMGYVLKNENPEHLKKYIFEVYKGNKCFSESISRKISMGFSDNSEESQAVRISKREKEILRLISLGYTTIDIADYLKLQKDTISDYRDVLMRKFEAKNAPDLIRIAYQWKILNLD